MMCVTGFLGSHWLPGDTATFMNLGSSKENEKALRKPGQIDSGILETREEIQEGAGDP